MEMQVLGKVLFENCVFGDYCVVGLVKINIGYLEVVVGVVGLIKVVLLLYYCQILFSLNFEEFNFYIKFDKILL